ncbi:hypothetical protein B0H66DRAFT_603486 [Apodospora peruviana]|uniref:Uncharacterized protein n=1 Tax=Apodospora peruviana TaxID=516989 RepID=A0AAE0I5F6_9PEZI|nr:hypothetical protein B0H66DRAFT_603486 [Apodospora peruviana]
MKYSAALILAVATASAMAAPSTSGPGADSNMIKRNGRPGGASPGEHCDTPGKFECFGAYAIQHIPFCVASV